MRVILNVKEDRSIAALGAGLSAGRFRRRAQDRKEPGGRVDLVSDAFAKSLLQAALDTFSAHVAMLDPQGVIVGVNRAWRQFGRDNGLKVRNAGIGGDYLAAVPRGRGKTALRQRFLEVLGGRSLGFRHHYWCQTAKGMRYFQMQVRRCGRSKWRRIIVAHEDVTDLKLAEDGLQELAGELARSRDVERRRLARELHDTTCQDLVVASLAVERIKRRAQREDAAGAGPVEELSQALDRALRDLRTLSYVLHPPTSSASDLAETLRTLVAGFARRAEMKVHFTTSYAGRPGERVERAILAIVQEALVNIHRHSGSKAARVALGSLEGALALTITDRGRWREGAEGVGLASMRERIADAGGTLTITPTRRGTRLLALLPSRKPRRASAAPATSPNATPRTSASAPTPDRRRPCRTRRAAR
jgi:signal transduction histidine kinase